MQVRVPLGASPEVEDALEQRYGLKEAVVVDSLGEDDQITRDLGAASAYYLETTLKRGEVIGVSSWSATLLAMVDALPPFPRPFTAEVVQILGGNGNPGAAKHAVQLVRRLSELVHGPAHFLPSPGISGSVEAQRAFLQDLYVQAGLARFADVTLALVGIGTLDPSQLVDLSGNVFSADELDRLRQQRAVGDICLRFFDAEGNPVKTLLEERVIGMQLDQLQRVKRCVGVAGGQRKREAIRGALRGRFVNVLVTDRRTADWLLAEEG